MAYDKQGQWIYSNPANVPGSGNASPSSAAQLSAMLAGPGAGAASVDITPKSATAPPPGLGDSVPPTVGAQAPKAVASPAGASLGGGWDQYATDPKSMAYGLKTALGQGMKGDDALNWMQNNGWAGAVNQNGSGIQAYGDGSFGLPGGLKVVNGANGPDIYEGGPKSGSSFGPQGGMFPSSLLGSLPTAGVGGGDASPNTSGADTAASIAAAQSGGNTQLAQLLAQLMGQTGSPNPTLPSHS